MIRKYLAYSHIVGAFAMALLTVFAAPVTLAFNRTMEDGAEAAKGADQPADLFGATGIFTTFTNVLLFIVGAVSVIMIIFGGLRYVISGGNSASVSAAKNTILYAVVGIIVAVLAYAIVNFVIGSFAAGSNGTDV